jgi:hypothetical protein
MRVVAGKDSLHRKRKKSKTSPNTNRAPATEDLRPHQKWSFHFITHEPPQNMFPDLHVQSVMLLKSPPSCLFRLFMFSNVPELNKYYSQHCIMYLIFWCMGYWDGSTAYTDISAFSFHIILCPNICIYFRADLIIWTTTRYKLLTPYS